ncbi:MAG: ribosomal protection-like ABC-F family protein [Cellulosilyticaceae bacterium]
MSIINISNLTFSYDTHYEAIFEDVSFAIDTDWKLGFIGRNGKGKTTFLNLLRGKYEYSGTIVSSVNFDYFPFKIEEEQTTLEAIRNIIAPYTKWEQTMEACLEDGSEGALARYGEVLESYIALDGYSINELIQKEINKLNVESGVLTRPFNILSNGEKTKLLLAGLFLKKNNFLLIDEPTNHLDLEGRMVLANYLKSKKGFILVSHDRVFLDEIIDHVLSINRSTIEVQKGNYSSWQDNKERKDQYELGENDKLKKEISRLEVAGMQTASWSHAIESSKVGAGPCDRGYIGHKSAKMMKRTKSIQNRQQTMIEGKKGLLKDIEPLDELKIHCIDYVKDRLIELQNINMYYGATPIGKPINITINQGERITLRGKNGCGKSTLIKLLIGQDITYTGTINKGSNLRISYVPQDTSHLKGTMKAFIQESDIDESLFKAILRKLDFKRSDFEKDLDKLSGGQKKKILIARSLSEKAHLYVWDEPLNFIDILSRSQIENLILKYNPTMVFVEHDRLFNENIATKVVTF